MVAVPDKSKTRGPNHNNAFSLENITGTVGIKTELPCNSLIIILIFPVAVASRNKRNYCRLSTIPKWGPTQTLASQRHHPLGIRILLLTTVGETLGHRCVWKTAPASVWPVWTTTEVMEPSSSSSLAVTNLVSIGGWKTATASATAGTNASRHRSTRSPTFASFSQKKRTANRAPARSGSWIEAVWRTTGKSVWRCRKIPWPTELKCGPWAAFPVF